MLINSTWQEYLSAILSSTVIYYLIVIALFYRSELKRFFKRKSPQLTYSENPNWPKAEYIREEEEQLLFPSFQHSEESFEELDELKNEIEQLIRLVKDVEGNPSDLTELFTELLLDHQLTAYHQSHLIEFIQNTIDTELPFKLDDETLKNVFPRI
ncbi:hypothetical protein D3C78_1253850 [compost metagenome]